MDTSSIFVTRFRNHWGRKNGRELEMLFMEGPGYFQSVSSDNIGILLDDLLNGMKSLPKFLRTDLDKINIEDIDRSLREAFTFLKQLITKVDARCVLHLQNIFHICRLALQRETNYETRQASRQTLETLLTIFPDYTTDLDEFAAEFIEKRALYPKNECSMNLQVLCTIARHRPKLPVIAIHRERIQSLVLNLLTESSDHIEQDFPNMEMYIGSLTDLLHVCPLEGSDTTAFYDLIKKLIASAESRISIDQNFIRTIIRFVTQHMQIIKSFIREDHKYWDSFFNNLLQNDSLNTIAKEAIKVYYGILGEILKRENSLEKRLILISLKGPFVKSLTDEFVNSVDKRINIVGYNELAEPLQKLIDNEALEEIFSFISRRTLPLFFSEDAATSHLEELADYQEALAQILIKVTSVTEDQISILVKMSILMIKRFPELTPNAQVYAAASFKRTIEFLSSGNIYLFDQFLSKVFYGGIAWSCSHSLLIDAELQQDLEKLDKRPICYKNYVLLWKTLLDREEDKENHKVAMALITTLLTLLSKLDLRTKTRDDNVFSHISTTQIAVNQNDFRIFLNLVDLYCEIFDKIVDHCWPQDLESLLVSIIKDSTKYPLISGFYRLVERCLAASMKYKKTFRSEKRLILDYLMKALELVFEFSDELQISCAQLILSFNDFSKDLLPHVAPVFILAFRLVRDYYELADGFIEDLNGFITLDDAAGVEALLLEVLPTLELHIRNDESLEKHYELETPVKQTTESINDLEPLQNKILLFFGRIKHSTMLKFLHKQAQDTGASWDRKNLLEYTMTFPDGDLSVHLETILPRIIELSLSCTNRRTRIYACRTLQSVIVLILGNTVQHISIEPDRYAPLYKSLLPVLLKLGCDNDEIIRQIFNPFMRQMTRWLSSKVMSLSPVSVGFLLECIFDGLHDSNSSIKDFSGICLAEFVKFSIKQATDSDSERIPDNIQIVVTNIKNLALHPLKIQKIASAIAFTHVYKILSENEKIVDIFWVEFFHCFLKVRSECNDRRVSAALDNVVKVFIEKPILFNEGPLSRGVPKDFKDGSSKSCIAFLLNEEMLKRLEGFSYDTKESISCLIGTLDVYIWCLEREFIKPQDLFIACHTPSNNIFSYVQKFIPKIDESNAVIKIFDFMEAVLRFELLEREKIHYILFDENFCNLVGKCITQSVRVGFGVENLDMRKILLTKIEIWVGWLCDYLTNRINPPVLQYLNSNFATLSKVLSGANLDFPKWWSFENELKSLVLMKRYKLLEKLQVSDKIREKKIEVIKYIFGKLKKDRGDEYCCVEPTPNLKWYFEGLLELSLNDEAFAWIINSKENWIHELWNSDRNSQIPHLQYFFITFRDILIGYLLNNIESCLNVLVSSDQTDFALLILNETAAWLQRNKKDRQEIALKFYTSTISVFGHFSNRIHNIEKRKKLLKRIYRTVIRLTSDVIHIKLQNQEMYDWILHEFQESKSIAEKTEVLSDFLICLVNDIDENIKMELMLRDFHVPQELRHGFPRPSLESTEVIQYFQTLITALPVTKSSILLEVVASFAMKLGKSVSNKSTTDHLISYFTVIDDGKAYESLEKIHRMFLDLSSIEEQFDLLRYFLLPAFRLCPELGIQRFFEENIRGLVSTITTELPEHPEDIRKKLIVSQTEAYNVLEIMFSTLDLTKINDSAGIAKKVFEVTQSPKNVLTQVFANARSVRKLTVSENDGDLMRLLHCAAFNCAVTIATISKEERFLELLFDKSPNETILLWERILDFSKKYSLTQTSKEPKQRNTPINISQTLNQKVSTNHFYLKTYNLECSTLAEDIAAYDMHNVMGLTDLSTSQTCLLLESDELNDHECMRTIVWMIRSISKDYSSDLSNPPGWLEDFTEAMLNNQENVKLFLLKVVLNTQKELKPLSKFLLKDTIKVISSLLENSPVTDTIADAILMLIDWTEGAKLRKDLKEDVNVMFDSFIAKIDESSSEAVVKFDYWIIDKLVKAWHPVLDPPKCLEEKMTRDKGVRIIFSLLENGLGPKLAEYDEILRYLLMSLERWKEKEEHILHTSTAIGLFLKFSALDPSYQLIEAATNEMSVVLRKMQEPNRLIKCVHAMCTAFPGLLPIFYEFVAQNHSQISDATKVKSMDMFLQMIPKLRDDQVNDQVRNIGLNDLLKNKVLACEKICLEVLLRSVEHLNSFLLLDLAELAKTYSTHKAMEYRSVVYDIFICIYKKYIGDRSCYAKDLVNLSKTILLSGLLDPSESLQQKCMSEIKMSTTCPERILDILYNYSSSLKFLPIFGMLFLNLSRESANYESKLFIPLAENYNYRNYIIPTCWRMKDLSGRVPLFISSLAGQCSQYFSLSSLLSEDFGSTSDDLMVRVMNPLEFEESLSETYVAEGNDTTCEDDVMFAVPEIPWISRRLVQIKTSPSRHHPSHQVCQLFTQEPTKQNSSAKLSRHFRIGDLPDISITHETILNPLQELIKKDPLTCKNLIVLIVSSLIKKVEDHRDQKKRKSCSGFTQKIREQFRYIFQNHRGGRLFISAVLEIMFKNSDLRCEPTVEADVAYFNGLGGLGALLIEEHLAADSEVAELSSKKSRLRVGNSNSPVGDWVDLAELYESIKDMDMVLSITSNHVPGSKLNAASAAQNKNAWGDAKLLYEQAINEEKGVIRRRCKRGLFECMARLSQWEEISSTIENDLPGKSLIQFLEMTQSRETEWITRWYLKSQIYQSFVGFSENKSAETFLDNLKQLVQTSDRLAEDFFSEELAVLYPTTMNKQGHELVLRALRKTKDEWSQLNSFSVQLRLQKIVKLGGLCDTKFYREEPVEDVRNLKEFWDRNLPTDRDDLLSWDFHVAQRTHIANALCNEIYIFKDRHMLSDLVLRQKMVLIESAYCQKNLALMTKYITDINKIYTLKDGSDVRKIFTFKFVQKKFLLEQLRNDDVNFKNLQECWEKCEEFDDSGFFSGRIDCLHLRADWCIEMSRRKNNNVENFNQHVSTLNESLSFLSSPTGLDDRTFLMLMHSISFAKEPAYLHHLPECHRRMLKYCHSRISKNTADSGINNYFVEYELRCMKDGSNEEPSWFPCILDEKYLHDAMIKRTFCELTRYVATWKFLKWQPQLLLGLSSPRLSEVVTPILDRLAEDYPNALFYNLQSILDAIPALQTHLWVIKVTNKCHQMRELKDFVEALEYLVRPELYLLYHLDDLLKNLGFEIDTNAAVDKLMNKVYNLKNPTMQGKLYQYISSFKDQISKMRDMSRTEIQACVVDLKSRLDESLRKKEDSNKLSDYSPYLSQMINSNLEIPAFYSGKSCPKSRYRPKIMKIEAKVQVMRSIRKPIKITIVGDDRKSYHFLVKFGEDLRLDQRIQQTFTLMNDILKADLFCSQRNLSIKTLKALPLSRTVGLIEWVDNAQTLQQFIDYSLHDGQKKNLLQLDKDYEDRINACSSELSSTSDKYREAVSQRSAIETISGMNTLIGGTDCNAFRRTLQEINPSAEGFMSFRKNFITSYSVMCVAQWILGIGNRYSENTLINIESGECTGMDFASAFGGGIDQAIPELMPFRLTKQILRLMEPFDERDLFSVTMVHALKAFRSQKHLIVAAIGGIAKEDLNWMRCMSKFQRDIQEEIQEVKVRWNPESKIETVRRKLDGDNPARVMIDELRVQHSEVTCFEKYEAIVEGKDDREQSFRATAPSKDLTAEEQVKCLVEQATDLNVLGRTHVRWRPYL